MFEFSLKLFKDVKTIEHAEMRLIDLVYTLRFVKYTGLRVRAATGAVLAVLCPLLPASAQYKALLSDHRLSSSTAAPFPVWHRTSASLFCHKGIIMRDKYHHMLISYGYLIHICLNKNLLGSWWSQNASQELGSDQKELGTGNFRIHSLPNELHHSSKYVGKIQFDTLQRGD